MKRLLVVEDEKDINDIIVHNLQTEGYEVESAIEGEEALSMIQRDHFDLVILDILLPGVDGWELCRAIRSGEPRVNIPIIFLSALTSEADRIKGFDLGCDDYLLKPFSPREMVSRVKAILRRAESNSAETSQLKVGNITIDLLRHRVGVAGKSVHLTNSEFQILNLLASNAGRVYSRDEMLTLMRENDSELELGNIDVHVHRLRHKLEGNPKRPQFIQTVWGVGYRLVRA